VDDEVVVVLPRSVRLEAQMVGGPPEQVAGMIVIAHPRKFEGHWGMGFDGYKCTGVVQADGSFTIDFLPFVKTDIEFRDADWSSPGICGSRPHRMATLQFDSEVAKTTIDAARWWPASVSLQLEGHGYVWVEGNEAAGVESYVLVVNGSHTCSGGSKEIDASGGVMLRGLVPDEYQVYLRSTTERWIFPLGDPFRLAPGEHRDLQFDLKPKVGRVKMIEATTGEVIRNAPFRLRVPMMLDRGGTFESDSEGWLELSLPAGTYTVVQPARTGFQDLSKGVLRWTGDGPTEEALSMKPL